MSFILSHNPFHSILQVQKYNFYSKYVEFMLLFNISYGAALAALHVLRMAGINNGDGVAIYDVCIIPLTLISHIIPIQLPSGKNRFAMQERLFNLVNAKRCILNIANEIIHIVRMSVLTCHILVEQSNPSLRPCFDDIFVLRHFE